MNNTANNEKEKISVVYASDILDCATSKAAKIIMRVTELQSHPKGNAFIQLKEWKKLGDDIIKYFRSYGTVLGKVATAQEDFEKGASRNNNKRWTETEDKLLIEMVCDESCSPYELASTFGRSIPAIKSRVSKLVGLKRLSAEVAGHFVGMLDGELIEGHIDGKVYK